MDEHGPCTRSFALGVKRHRRTGTIEDIAREFHLDWDAVKPWEMAYICANRSDASIPQTRTPARSI